MRINSTGVNFCLLHSKSIGRLLANTEYYLRKQSVNRNNRTNIFISGEPIIPYMIKLLNKKEYVIQNQFLYEIFQNLNRFPFFKKIINTLESTGFYDWETWTKAPAQLFFNDEEHNKGKKILKELGVNPDAEFVCVHARDNSFTDSKQKRDDFWVDNDFRDCSIDNFIDALEYLADKGIYVIRLGTQQSPPLKTNNPKIIDYATKFSFDFTDIYLSANCKFFLGNTSSTYLMASIFDVPVAQTNMVPLGECGRKKEDIYIVKKLINKETNIEIPFSKIYQIEQALLGNDKYLNSNHEQNVNYQDRENSLFYTRLTQDQIEKLNKKNIVFQENFPEEILELVKEVNDRIDGNYNTPSDFEKIQTKILSIFPENHPFTKNKPVSTMCYNFSKKNIHLWEKQ